MKFDFKGKTILIQGGTQGVGRRLVDELLSLGSKVIFTGIENEIGLQIINKLKNRNLFFFHLDLKDLNQIKFFFDSLKSTHQSIDGYVHYAGITDISPLDQCDEITYDNLMDINTKATFFSIQELLPFMKSNGGSIVLIGSSQADRGQADRTAYAMSKGALITLNKHISKHFGKYKIRCNNLVMGWTLTENELKLRKSLGQTEKDLKEIAKNYVPLGRLTRIDDIFPSILFLLSDYSSMVTGSTINVNGGEII